MARLTRSDIEDILSEWQRRLNLSHWRIKIEWDKELEDAVAEFAANDHYDSADIRIAKGFEQWDRREANVTVVHELVHLVMRDIFVAVGAAESKLPKGAWEILDGWVTAGQEKAVEHLAQVIVDLGGIV